MRPPFVGPAALVGVVCVAGALGWPGTAHALEPEVTSDTAFQFYDVRGPTGETVVPRRRMTTTLGVSAYDLLDAAAKAERNVPELQFRARLRYDADYGANPAEADPTSFGRLVPGFSRGPVDLMYAYVEGRKFAGGWLGFKLGRQYTTDSLGWWSFDGATVRATTPYWFAVEAYGGLEVRGGMPLAASRFEGEGISRGSRKDYDPSLYPSFQPSDVAPALGVAIESAGPTWIHGRLTYRRVYNTGVSNVSEWAGGISAPAAYDGVRISQERIGYSADATLSDLAGAKIGLAYDLYVAKLANAYASVDWFTTRKLTLSADYDFYRPTFDGDSIWNFFASEPMNHFGLRASYDLSDYLSLAGGANVRAFETQTSILNDNPSPVASRGAADPNFYPSNGVSFNEGFHLAINQRVGENVNAIRSVGDFGSAGNRVGGDLLVQRLLYSRLLLSGRPTLWHWNDKLRPDRDATSFGFVAGIGYKLATRTRLLCEYQVDFNRLAGMRNRAMVSLSVAVF